MNLKQLTKQKRKEYPKRMPTLRRIKIGRAVNIIAALPLGTSWMALAGIPMSMTMSPTMWPKDKYKNYKINRSFK